MGKDVNEDLIEATIQRVAAARAAQEGSEPDAIEASGDAKPSPTAEPSSDSPGDDPAESMIEATIRRVALEKAARVARPEQPWNSPEPAAKTGAATIAMPMAEAIAPDIEAQTSGDDPAESMIEATIRRVALEKAARVARPEQPWNQPEPEANSDSRAIAMPVSDAIAPEVKAEPREEPRLQAASESVKTEEATVTPEVAPVFRAAAAVPAPQPAAMVANGAGRASGSSAVEAVSRIELGLADTAQTMRSLIERLDSLLPVLERIADAPAAPPASTPQPFNSVPQQHEEWDDAPVLPRMPMGQIPRPAIMRDPSPQTATAEHLVPAEADVIDTRPIPKPLPPLHVEPKRGFDLLPRTYRITVEDKRRGVDLVPLHRALLSMEGVKDMSLLSYNNGVAIVALETLSDLDPEVLASFVSRAMSRDARVEVHNERTMVVKLAED